MSQQINLYQPMFRRERKVFSAWAMVELTAVVLVALLAISGVVGWNSVRQARQVDALQARATQLSAQVENLRRQYPAPKRDEALVTRADALAKQLKTKKAFLDQVVPGAHGPANGYAAYLGALARAPHPGLWLSHLRFEGADNMIIEGGATSPRKVPDLVHYLGRQPEFSGRNFDALRIVREAKTDGSVHFLLRNGEPAQ